MTARVLVAGIGNIFLGDDGFGPEVVRRLLAGGPPPTGVRVTDYGIRGMHLAYDLLDGWDTLILVDALPAAPPPQASGPAVNAFPAASAPQASGPAVDAFPAAPPSPVSGSAHPGEAVDALPAVAATHVAGGARPVDAVPAVAATHVAGGARPGEVVVAEVGPDDLEAGDFDAHGMQPVAVLGSLTTMGGKLPPTYLVGCPVESVHEGIGLSPAVAAAVPTAIDAILALLDRLALTGAEPLAEPGRP